MSDDEKTNPEVEAEEVTPGGDAMSKMRREVEREFDKDPATPQVRCGELVGKNVGREALDNAVKDLYARAERGEAAVVFLGTIGLPDPEVGAPCQIELLGPALSPAMLLGFMRCDMPAQVADHLYQGLKGLIEKQIRLEMERQLLARPPHDGEKGN